MIRAMSLAEADLYALFDRLGLSHRGFAHGPAHTVADARAVRGPDMAGGHAKNLFVKDRKGGLWLVVADEDTAVDLGAVEKHLGAPRLSFARPELMVEILGVTPGAVTPLALANPAAAAVRLILDTALLAHPVLHFHPLRNDRTTALSREDFLRFLDAVGHPPVVVDLGALAAARAAARAAGGGDRL